MSERADQEAGIRPEEYEARKALTFEQAEGVEPLPEQLTLKTASPQLRAMLYGIVHTFLSVARSPYGFLNDPWRSILYREHIDRRHEMADTFANDPDSHIRRLSKYFKSEEYSKIFGFIQFVLRRPDCPPAFRFQVGLCLKECRAAYRVINADTIMPIGSEEEAAAVENAQRLLSSSPPFSGARQHLLEAAAALSAGEFAGSVRESIHAVESAARIVTGKNSLGEALTELEKTTRIHPAMKRGFAALYGYTSDESGIRHPLLENAAADASEADALFMIGACAAFTTYLVQKARSPAS